MTSVMSGVLAIAAVLAAVCVGFLVATALFVVQLRRAQRRITELESGELRHLEPGVQRGGTHTGFTRVAPARGRSRAAAESAARPGWTAVVLREGAAPHTGDAVVPGPADTVLMPTGIVGLSGGLFATEEAAESFRRDHLSRFEELHRRLSALAEQARDALPGEPDLANRLITLPTD